MQAASVVEGILCRVTTPDRATAMVGDLVEIREQRGAVWFWLSAAGVLLTLMWRWPLAFVVSFYAGARSAEAFMWATTGVNSAHRTIGLDFPWGPVFEGICLVGSCSVALSVFAAIRYGVRERATQMVLAWATLAAAAIYLWWVPVVLVTCIAGAAALISYSVCAHEAGGPAFWFGRRSLLELRASSSTPALALFTSIGSSRDHGGAMTCFSIAPQCG
jgi:hypothetical protein